MFFEEQLTTTYCENMLATIDSDSDFGQLLYQITSKRNQVSALAPDLIVNAANDLFGTAFAIFANSHLFLQMATPEIMSGIHSRKETRIVVVTWAAYTVVSILAVAAILNVLLFVSRLQESMLLEEPKGLLGSAILLHESNIDKEVVTDIETNALENERPRDAAKRLGHLHMNERYGTNDENRIMRLSSPPSTMP